MATVRKYRGRYVADFRDQHNRRRIEVPEGHFETKAAEKRAAEDLLAKRQGEVRGNTFTPDRQRVTFEKLSEMWLASKVKIADSSRDDYKITLRCYLLPYFGDWRATEIAMLDIETFRSELSEGIPKVISAARQRHLEQLQAEDPKARLPALSPGPRTVNKCLTVIGAVLRYGAKHEILSKNVAAGIEKLPTDQGEDRVIEQNVLTPAELKLALEHSLDPWRIPIMLAMYTGMRQGEVLALQWGDIDWNAGTVAVCRSLTRKKKLKTPKTTSSRRVVELPPVLLSELKRWRLACPKDPNGAKLDLVCPSTRGGFMDGGALLNSGLHPALRRAGIRQVRFHDLRHSYASNLLAAGEDIVRVSHDLGHANVHITLTTYAHAIPKTRRGGTDRMAALIAGDGGNNLETSAVSGADAGAISAA